MRDSIKNFKRSYNWISLGYVILGVIFLVWPQLSLMTLCYSFGILTIVYGIVHLIGYFVRDRMISVFRYDMVIGIIGVALGILILIRPQYIISILPILLGLFIILSSIMKVQNAFDLKRIDYPRWWLVLVFAAVSIALGLVLIWNPFAAASTLMMFIGASLCVDGLMSLWSMFCLSRSLKRVKKAMDEMEAWAGMEHVDGEIVLDEVIDEPGQELWKK